MFSSKYTTWLGIVVEVITFLERLSTEKPIPDTPEQWYRFVLQIAIGIGLILSKDFNKTNAVHANPVPSTAPSIQSVMPDPTTQPKG